MPQILAHNEVLAPGPLPVEVQNVMVAMSTIDGDMMIDQLHLSLRYQEIKTTIWNDARELRERNDKHARRNMQGGSLPVSTPLAGFSA